MNVIPSGDNSQFRSELSSFHVRSRRNKTKQNKQDTHPHIICLKENVERKEKVRDREMRDLDYTGTVLLPIIHTETINHVVDQRDSNQKHRFSDVTKCE